MIGKFTLTRIDKCTGESSVVLSESNQIAEGMKHAIVNILTSTGSKKLEDYQFGYYQLGTDSYDLSTYDVSADVPAESLKSNVWTIKSPMTISQYGRDSVIAAVERDTYGLGSIRTRDSVKVFDNFVDSPASSTISDSYTNDFQDIKGRFSPGKTQNTTWITGCASGWSASGNNYFLRPLVVSSDTDVSGPTFTSPTWSVQYNSSSTVNGISACLKSNNSYLFNDGTRPSIWNVGKTNQSASLYVMANYHNSGTATSGSTPWGGALQLNNTTANTVVSSVAGENRVSFKYRYDLTDTNNAKWYPPVILPTETYSGYSKCVDDCLSGWNNLYGLDVSGGTVSGNVYCPQGALYTVNDALVEKYATRNGPGAACYDTVNSGFGPSGNFFRVSISWAGVPDEVLNVDVGTASGCVIEMLNYPLLSSLSGVNNEGITLGIMEHERTPREQAYVANFQFEYSPSSSPYQYIHGESPYYITNPQDFLVLPKGYVTSHIYNTANVRLLLDEDLANSQTIKEVGLFLKNPGGNVGVDAPFLCAYKTLSPGISKNSEFSYIIDWELSLVDSASS